MGKYVQLVDNYPLYEQQYYHRLYTRQRRTTLMHAMRGVRHQVRMCMLSMGGGCYAAVYGQDSTPAKGAQPLATQDTTSPAATQPAHSAQNLTR